MRPHEKIREDALKKIASEMGRAIVGSQFSTLPLTDEEYYPAISDNPFYLAVYTRWVLSQSPIPELPTDAECYRLRKDILNIQADGSRKLDKPLLEFFVDMFRPFLEQHINAALAYYDLQGSQPDVKLAMYAAVVGALTLCDEAHIKKEGYDHFYLGFLDLFKVFFYQELKVPIALLPVADEPFIAAFESEWTRLCAFSDSLYGFEIMPSFSPEEMFRYLHLPFADKKYLPFLKTPIYRQAMNYVAGIATFKPVPDFRLRVYYRQELCKLFLPLIRKLAKRTIKERAFMLREEELVAHLEKRLSEAGGTFDFFHATSNKLKKKEISGLQTPVFPLHGTLVKLGHITSGDEYPFTAYATRALEYDLEKYFKGIDFDASTDSLDENVFSEDGGVVGSKVDLMSDIGVGAVTAATRYDAKDENGMAVGWKSKTFAGIIGKSFDTLRRWDREGYLKPSRYLVYSKRKRKKIPFRAYVLEDIAKAKEIARLKAHRQRLRR